MDKEKLTKKIKKLSRFTFYAMIFYCILNCCDIWPDNVKRHNVDMDINDMPLWKGILSIAAIFFLVVGVVGAFISAMKTMSYLSKGRTPFTKKIANRVRDLGIYFIVMEIACNALVFIGSGKIEPELFWLAGLVLYAFSVVFRYGAKLQKESDETL
ncbi:AbgT family transporter [Ruminococcus sp.]|uniref:AbgT family transporter n=1 Tax=Ruminococcus sp. TaxID=41978 RepID=UPI0025FC2F8D|nr:AbgT family transporter [Ruminococcus sp.]MBR1432732.1 AbgT family transporter [Ruminococcus sp.]